MSEFKEDTKPKIEGWYSVRFKNKLSKAECDDKGLVSSFIDWVFFNGQFWDAPEYKESGFYVLDIIKLESTKGVNNE